MALPVLSYRSLVPFGMLLSTSNEKLPVPLLTTANGPGPTLAAGPTLCNLPLQMHTALWAQMIMCECLDYYVFCLEYVKSVCRQIVLLLMHSLHIGLSQRTVFK